MNELQFHKDAVFCAPNQVDFTISFRISDKDGNCVQVIPFTATGLCYPYDIKDAIEQLVQQLNGRISSGE